MNKNPNNFNPQKIDPSQLLDMVNRARHQTSNFNQPKITNVPDAVQPEIPKPVDNSRIVDQLKNQEQPNTAPVVQPAPVPQPVQTSNAPIAQPVQPKVTEQPKVVPVAAQPAPKPIQPKITEQPKPVSKPKPAIQPKVTTEQPRVASQPKFAAQTMTSDFPKITEQFKNQANQSHNQPLKQKTQKQPKKQIVKQQITKQQTQNINQENQVDNQSQRSFFGRFRWLILAVSLFAVYQIGTTIYNNAQLSPISPNNDNLVKVTVKSGSSIDQVGETLADKKLVRNASIFSKYAQGQSNSSVQEGDFYLTKSQSVQELFAQINKGPNPAVYQKQFITERAPYAQELQEKYGVLASINLAQTILESDWGESKLASKYNNYYGIKAQGDQKSVTMQTKEFLDDEWVTVDSDFAVYDDWKEGMLAHVDFLVNGTDLNEDQFEDFMATDNYKDAAEALMTNGYATDPDYANKLIQTIEANNLQKYDK